MASSSRRLAGRLSRSPQLRNVARRVARRLAAPHRVGAQAILLDADGDRVMLVRSVLHPDSWGLPGGWVRRHEDPSAAVIREIREELAIEAVADGIVACEVHDVDPRRLVGEPSGLTVAYLCRPVDPGAATPTCSAELVGASWFDVGEAGTVLGAFETGALRAAISRPGRPGRRPEAERDRP